MLLTTAIFIAVLAVLILVHELGHFIAAKRAGIKVEEFGIGFPPRLYGKKRGETVYSINLIPLGGFVRLYGEEGSHSDSKRSFSGQSIWNRVKVVSAGILMNFLFGFLILLIYFSFGNPPAVSDPGRFVSEDKIEYRTLVLQVKENSAAAKIGIKEGDYISRVNNQLIGKVEDLTKFTEPRPGDEITVSFGSNGQQTKSVKLDNVDGKGRLGVMVGQTYGQIGYSWWQVPWVAAEETVRIIGLIFYYVYKILERLIVKGQVEEGVVGPVGIFMLTRQVVQLGLASVLRFIAFLSINLGVVNFLPFPALDGGQLVFLGFEKARGKKIRQSVEHGLQVFGFAVLIILIILITYRDVIRLFQ